MLYDCRPGSGATDRETIAERLNIPEGSFTLNLIASNSKSLLAAGFATIALLMGLTAGISISIINSRVSRIDALLFENKQKSSLIAQMQRITRERTVS